MKMNTRTLGLALAALSVLAVPAAHAEDSVTVYGKIDLGALKDVGETVKQIATGSDGRLGFKGTHDLGNGLQSFFQLEHRFFPDTGVQDGVMWKGLSKVGLSGAFGQIGLGRQYAAAFSMAQNKFDPWEGYTVGQLRDVGVRVGAISKTRVDGSVRYDWSGGGLNAAVSLAESDKNGGGDRPISVGANYKWGDWFVAAGIEDPAGDKDRLITLGAAVKLGAATVSAGMGRGRTVADVEAKGWLLAMNLPVGAGEIKAGYATQQRGGTTMAQKMAVGYHHPLSKRTLIYTDLAHDRKASTGKTGWDVGMRVTF